MSASSTPYSVKVKRKSSVFSETLLLVLPPRVEVDDTYLRLLYNDYVI